MKQSQMIFEVGVIPITELTVNNIFKISVRYKLTASFVLVGTVEVSTVYIKIYEASAGSFSTE